MKVKFANGVIKECASPTEQKIIKTINGATVGSGWLLMLRLVGPITSDEIDAILTNENIASLEFLNVSEEGEEQKLFTLDGYCKVSSSSIRYADDINETQTEISLTKGV